MTEAIRQGDIPGVQLRRRVRLSCEPARAWAFATEGGHQERWLCRSATTTDAIGGTLEWRGNAEFGPDALELGEVIDSEPPRRWVIALRQSEWETATRLEFEFSPLAEGCELSVLQNGFEHLPLSLSLTVWEAYRRHWSAALEQLASLAAA